MLALLKLLLVSSYFALVSVARPAGLTLQPQQGLKLQPQQGGGQTTLGVCPTWTVRCVKDNDYPSGIVGDIGKKPFCFRFPRCYQCTEEANSDECNIRFPECEGACTAYSPIPF